MKFKLFIPIISLFTLSTTVQATVLLDSIGVENNNGKKVILHKLDPKDNYFSIGRRYNVRPNLIIQYNHNAVLKIGNVIKVPTEVPFSQTNETVTAPATPPTVPPVVKETRPVATPTNPSVQSQTQPNQTAPTTTTPPDIQQYKVSAGETLYAIAQRFNTTVEEITRLNNLTSNYLAPGRILKVRANTPNPPVTVQSDAQDVAVQDSTQPQEPDSTSSIRANRYGLFEKNEKGIATWLTDSGLDSNKKLVLHKSAPIGTVIKIVNPMTNRTTFAKVVGRFTDNEATRDVVIVMTKNVAESLGALDKRFQVSLSYGSPNE